MTGRTGCDFEFRRAGSIRFVQRIAFDSIIDFGPRIRPSDANSDYAVNLIDCVDVLRYLFADDHISCEKAADFDGSGEVNLPDAIGLINGLFNGATIPGPFPICGIDPLVNPVGCTAYSGNCP